MMHMKPWILFLFFLAGCQQKTAYNNPSYHILYEDDVPAVPENQSPIQE